MYSQGSQQFGPSISTGIGLLADRHQAITRTNDDRHCWYHMIYAIWHYRNWSLPKGTKPLPEPMLKYYQYGSAVFSWGESYRNYLTHWGRVMHICISKLNSIGSDNGLSPGRCQAIIWTNAGILLIGPSGTSFSEILIKIQTFSFKEVHLKMLSGKCCLSPNVLRYHSLKCVWIMKSCSPMGQRVKVFTTKPLPEPMMTKIIKWPLQTTMSWSAHHHCEL